MSEEPLQNRISTLVAVGLGAVAYYHVNPSSVVNFVFKTSRNPQQDAGLLGKIGRVEDRVNLSLELADFDDRSPVSHQTIIRCGAGLIAFVFAHRLMKNML